MRHAEYDVLSFRQTGRKGRVGAQLPWSGAGETYSSPLTNKTEANVLVTNSTCAFFLVYPVWRPGQDSQGAFIMCFLIFTQSNEFLFMSTLSRFQQIGGRSRMISARSPMPTFSIRLMDDGKKPIL